MKRVVVGRITGVFGIVGELKCKATPLGENAFAAGESFTLGSEPAARTVRCRGARRHHERLLLAFEGVTTPEAAREFVGAELYAEAGDVELGPDEYLDADLIGMRLLDEQNRELGRVAAVQHYPAQDCLVVEPGGGMVPLVKAFVRAVDVKARTIVTSLPEGLL
ncbi:MAG: 16S rRNA processing protein RimM [Candidatus Eremiobacteraeota bacterium]|nr:16S rRNA processing protein RimM [Candidatus Eremiobacteraeota bacterium]